MYIKKVEIQGFKSFADRVSFELSPGINCVVGPNGCGKSNILDAVRWVLGEQKYSVLRSKSSEQVIFTGTSRRKTSGMAQVVITFDNEDGGIKVDSPEVSLLRRFFREGTGQFKLNNKNLRLKDVHELLADTGIGSGALFILSNQEIDRVLSPSSDERRAILEETAGVNKYQFRKKETLRKLESTRENMARLNDILQEVARQTEVSKKQLKRLESYRKIREKLSSLEVELLKGDLKDIDDKSKQMDLQIDRLENDRDSLKKQNNELEYRRGVTAGELEELNRERDREKEELGRVHLEEEKLKGAAELTGEKIRQSGDALVEYRDSLNRLNRRIEEITDKVQTDTETLEKIKNELKGFGISFEKLNDEYESRKVDFKRIEDSISSFREKLRNLNENLEKLTLQKNHADEVLGEIIQQRKSHDENREQRIRQMDMSRGNMDEWTDRYEKILQEIEKTGKELDNAKKYLDESRDEHQKARQSLLSLKDVLREAQSELSLLIREEENFRGFSPAYSAIMKTLGRELDLVAIHTVLKVEPRYETAADIILGGHFQSIITRTKKDADRCIDYLKREKAGRLTFFPMDLSRSAGVMPALPGGLPGVVGWARDLIDCDSVYREIVDQICGKTLVVEDLDSAYAIYGIQKKNRGFLPRIVTLEGDVLDFSGSVTGGRFKVDRSKLLFRGRRRKELEQLIQEKTLHSEKLIARMKNLEEGLIPKEALHQKLLVSIDQKKKEADQIQNQLKLLKALGQRADEDLKQYDETGGALEEKRKTQEAAIAKLEKQIGEIRERLSEEKAEFDKLEAENSQYLNEARLLSQRREMLKSQMAENQNQCELLEARIQSGNEFIRQNQKDREELELKIKNREEHLETLRNSYQETLNQKSILSLKLKGLEKALSSTFLKNAGVEKNLQEIDSLILENRKKQEALVEDANRIKIEKIELSSKADFMNQRLEEFPPELRQVVKWTGNDRQVIKEQIDKNRQRLSTFDDVNFSAGDEYEENQKRYDFLNGQLNDLSSSVTELREIIREMDQASLKALEETLQLLNVRFGELFKKVFGGGTGSVYFSDPENKLESGVEVEVQPPGKRPSSINQLSTGEKSLTAVTLLFALLSIKPGPFVILDELDAPLDEANVEKIANLIREFSIKSQFVVITHNRKTMEFADNLLGVTMQEPGVSKLVSVKFEEIDKFTGDGQKKVPA